MPPSRRAQFLVARPVNRDSFIQPWADTGLIVFDSPNHPTTSLRVEDGRIVDA